MTTHFKAGLGISLYYAFLFAAMGAQIPFWPLWLTAKGFSPTQIGLALAATYFARIVATPLTGILSDHLAQRRLPMIWLAGGAAITWGLFAWAPNFASVIAITLIAQGLWTGLMPLGETLALATAVRWAINYGRMRLWGSLTFIIASVVMGWALEFSGPGLLVWVIVANMAATALTCWSLADIPPTAHQSSTGSVSTLLSDPAFLWFLTATGLNQISHTIYYGFSSLHWSQAGLSSQTIGLLWGEGVLAEVVLFAFSAPVITRLGSKGLLIAAALGGIVRWTALGASTSLMILVPAQILHAATFCAAHLGAMIFLSNAIAPPLSARAQGLYASLACGVGPGVMALASGGLYHHLEGKAFWCMAVLSALSLLACLKISSDQRQKPLTL